LRPASGAFTELAMTRSALIEINLFAILYRPAAGWSALPIGTYVYVPTGNLLRRGQVPNPVVDGRVLFALREHRHDKYQ
jgi:hypothetical protein